jgi:asparagine synthase (glutamine-hydrolysing)
MCGIAGIIDSSLSRDQGEGLLKNMLETIRYRGPDNSSQWIDMPVLLGHDRLSIIDLSDAANQPMEFANLIIVYNGEVYNYLEIRDELIKKGYRFRTNSDTEVVLAAYQEWGSDCVKRFVGMWAFAIWDKTKKELFCSRDRFGIKPLYYIHQGDKFYFASEYKALKISPLFDNKFNYSQINRGLLLLMVSYDDETYFKCLKILPERTNLSFKDGKITLSEYWDIDPSKQICGTFEDKKRQFLELFRNSVKLHMRSDVEVGGSLSGGLDSSAIASVVGNDYGGRRYKTFTIYYKGKDQVDERNWVRQMIDMYPNIDPVYCSPSDDEVATSFHNLTVLHDVPIQSTSAISYYFIMKVAAQNGIKVMLDGQGSDEYLAGYLPSFDRLIGGYLRRLRIISALEALRSYATPRGLGRRYMARMSLLSAVREERQLYSAELLGRRSSVGFDGSFEFDLRHFGGSRLKRYLYHILFSTILPSRLHYLDRMSMAFSIESRVPFLNHRLIEFAHALRDEDLVFQGQSKYILRASLEGFLPKTITERIDKQGFVGREAIAFLRGPLRYLIESKIDFDRLWMLDPKKTNDLIGRFKAGSNLYWDLVFRIGSLNYWFSKN